MAVLINNEILEDPDITGKELIVYCILQGLYYSHDRDSVLFRYGEIHFILTGEVNMRPCDRVNYVTALKSLSDKGYISIKILGKGRYILNLRHFDLQDEQLFTPIEMNNIIKLYRLYKAKAYSLCKQYLYILKVIGSRHYYGISIGEIAAYTNLSPQTISKNNALLNESGFLYILFTTTQKYYNTYGKPEYKEEIDALGKKRGITENSNMRRSISARYSYLKVVGTMKLEDAERLLADMEREIAEHPDLVSDRWNVNEVKEYIAKLKPESINAIEDDEFIRGLFS